MTVRTVRRPPSLRGVLRVPGDKSISHRAVLFGAIAEGETQIDNFLVGADCLSTVACVRALGVQVALTETPDGTSVTVRGVGLDGLQEPADVLDCGNSGTTMRLLSGLLAGRPFLSVLTGDASLRTRPMGRVLEPLRAMGARVAGRAGDRLPPVVLHGGELCGMEHHLPVASAQLKSALILAGLRATGETLVQEPAASRNHTELMLAAMGAPLTVDGTRVRVRRPGRPLAPLRLRVPGDLSAAAFWLVAAACHPDAEVTVTGVGLNPTRAGVIEVLRAMGADLTVRNERLEGGEPVGDITVRSSRLRGTVLAGTLIPRAIDEIPVLALAAAIADGDTIVRDAAELRVKESDRIATTAAELGRLGARIEPLPDGMVIRGGAVLRGARCHSRGDHRLAMTLAVAGLLADGETLIEDAGAVDVSYPAFWHDLARLSGEPAPTEPGEAEATGRGMAN
jgi:3-phosphoshikimate 1-carboxyvinyltransferase